MVIAMSKTWFITGASRGFGRTFVEAALDHGDNVVGTARDITALADLRASHPDTLLPVTLDVTDKAAVDRAVQQAVERFGRLDVVVNNAGYGLFGAVEEITGQQLRDQLETNLFGALWVTQAALPIMRGQGAGHIVQVSSVGGVLTFPLLGGYHASKWALEGLSDSLAQEVAGFDIKVTLVQPGPYATDWGGASATFADTNSVYDPARAALDEWAAANVPGDPDAVGEAMLAVVYADDPPLRVFFGSAGLQLIPGIYADRLKTWAQWADVSHRAQGQPVEAG